MYPEEFYLGMQGKSGLKDWLYAMVEEVSAWKRECPGNSDEGMGIL